jgi:hypothetical protein
VTQVWAAVGEEWKDKGGVYLAGLVEQRSSEGRSKEEGMFENGDEGYAAWAYDQEGEEKL